MPDEPNKSAPDIHEKPKKSLSDFVDALSLIDAIRDRVVTDITDKDALRLETMIFQRLEQRDEIRRMVRGEFYRVFTIAASVTTAVVAVLAFLGINKLEDAMESIANQKVISTLDGKFKTEVEASENKLQKAIERFDERYNEKSVSLAEKIIECENSVKSLLMITERDMRKLTEESLSTMRKRKDEGLVEIDKRSSGHLTTLDDRISRFSEGEQQATKRLETTVQLLSSNIFLAGGLAQTALGEKVKIELKTAIGAIDTAQKETIEYIRAEARKLQPGVSQSLASAPVPTGHPSFTQTKSTQAATRHDVQALEIFVKRDVGNLIEIAHRAAKDGDFEAATSILQPVVIAPDRFTAKEHEEAAKIFLDPQIGAVDRLGYTVELFISACRNKNPRVFEMALSARANNFLFALEDSALADLAIAVYSNAPTTELTRSGFKIHFRGSAG